MLAGAFKIPWDQRKPLARAIIVPLLVMVGVELIAELELLTLPETLEWVWMFIYCVPTAWLAVYVHRFLLRDLSGAHTGLESGIGKRVALYALLVIAFWALFFGATFFAEQFGTPEIPPDDAEDLEQPMAGALQTATLIFASAVISALIGSRLCLVLPAVAVGGDVRAAVHAARGNTLRLTVVFALLPILLIVITLLLFRDDASAVESGLLVVLGAIFTIVEVAALSLAYRELTQPAPPPTDPPA